MTYNFIKWALVESTNEPKTLELYDLPYSRTDLDPSISKETLDVHYGKLAKGYVDRYNAGEGDPDFNEAGAYLHNILFAQYKKPESSNSPTGAILEFIEKHFKSFNNFVEKFEFEKMNKGLGKDLTESQGKASAFQSQMVSASNAVNTLEKQGFDPTSFKSQTAVRLAGGVANPVIPVAAQQYKQAQDQWSEAYLRFKTGAAATEPEVVRNNRTFFPVFGDKPEQIAQKAAAREQAERDIGIAAGRGAGLGAQSITPIAKPEAKPTSMPSQSAIDAELKRRGLK